MFSYVRTDLINNIQYAFLLLKRPLSCFQIFSLNQLFLVCSINVYPFFLLSIHSAIFPYFFRYYHFYFWFVTSMSICEWFNACLARWSASSFPFTPICDGTHTKLTRSPYCLILKRLCITSFIMSCLANDFPLDKLFSAERESVHITAFVGCISSIHWSANKIAISSAVNTEIWSLVLFDILILNRGLYTDISPTAPVVFFKKRNSLKKITSGVTFKSNALQYCVTP